MQEPTTYTNVIDAVDGDDPFDVTLHLGFSRLRETAVIQREQGIGGGFVDIGNYEHIQNRLDIGLDIGLFRDLALMFRIPLVLSDTRDIRATRARPRSTVNQELCTADPTLAAGEGSCTPTGGGEGDPLFALPVDSPTRSGVEYLGVGLAYSIFNQHRSPHLPTWLIQMEGRFGLGDPMTACVDDGAGLRCNGGASGSGVSRATNAFRIETRASRRFRFAEPYAGLGFQIEWAKSGDDFLPRQVPGFLNDLPPRVGEFTFGVAFVPWEQRERFQRFEIDLRAEAKFISEGHDYSPLYDALGASESQYLSLSNSEGIGTAQDIPFLGLTDVQAHGQVGGRLAIRMQAARYVRFGFGAGVFYTTPHMITFADACNPTVTPVVDDPRQGRCRTGIINPHHRPTIDVPGQRFRVDGMLSIDFFASLSAQF